MARIVVDDHEPTPGSAQSPFTVHNIPYGIISTTQNPTLRCATAFGSYAVDLGILYERGLFNGIQGFDHNLFASCYLNGFAASPREVRREVRARLSDYLSKLDPSTLGKEPAFVPLSEAQNHFPMATQNFSDFYCSLEHTANCTAIFSPNPINPNWFAAPMVYNGRTSSLVVSGTPIVRPCGIYKIPPPSEGPNPSPSFQPESHLDFELEMGVFLSKPLPRGQRLVADAAQDHIFGLVMLNDWSARDIQLFEMPPLGPFHSKGSGTSISPWIVTMEALQAVASARKSVQEPTPLSHLTWTDAANASFNIEVSVKILRNGKSYTLGQSNLNELHWTPFQQLAHLSSAGEGLSTGDLFGTGTISSSRTDPTTHEKIGLGCLFERKREGNKLSAAPADIVDTFLQDGDEVVMEGWCVDPQSKVALFGFGECRGVVRPAVLP